MPLCLAEAASWHGVSPAHAGQDPGARAGMARGSTQVPSRHAVWHHYGCTNGVESPLLCCRIVCLDQACKGDEALSKTGNWLANGNRKAGLDQTGKVGGKGPLPRHPYTPPYRVKPRAGRTASRRGGSEERPRQGASRVRRQEGRSPERSSPEGGAWSAHPAGFQPDFRA